MVVVRSMSVWVLVGVLGLALCGCASGTASTPSGPGSPTPDASGPTGGSPSAVTGSPTPSNTNPPAGFASSTATPNPGIPTAGLPMIAAVDCLDLSSLSTSLGVEAVMAENQYDPAGGTQSAFAVNYAQSVAAWPAEIAIVQRVDQHLLAAGYPATHPFIVELQALFAAYQQTTAHAQAGEQNLFAADVVARETAFTQVVQDLGTYCAP